MGVNVNCKYYSKHDCNCNKKPKFLGLIKSTCSELFSRRSCELKEEWPRPKFVPHPQAGMILTEEEKEVIRVMRKDW